MDRVKNLIKNAKSWDIPENVALQVIERDKACIYCGCEFEYSIRAKKPSWEHIINDIKLTSRKQQNIQHSCPSGRRRNT